MGGILPLYSIPFIAGLYAVLIEHLEIKCVRTSLGISRSNPAGILAEPDHEQRHQAEDSACSVHAEFYLCDVLCGIVRILLSPTGMLNMLLGTSYNFMTMPEAFRTIYIASGIWQGAGWASIIYTAALSNASKELKEAAVLDGANIIQQIKAVEWPAIKDTVLIQFIMSVGNIMSVGFEKAYALQTDLNLDASEIISTYVYKKGLLDGDMVFPLR